MLPKKYKLDSREVELVMTKGKFVTTDLFLLKILTILKKEAQDRSINRPRYKISVIAPKKPFNTAVLRNFIRRRVYGSMGPIFDGVQKKAKNNTNEQVLLCLVCNKLVESQEKTALITGIEQVFKKGGIIV